MTVRRLSRAFYVVFYFLFLLVDFPPCYVICVDFYVVQNLVSTELNLPCEWSVLNLNIKVFEVFLLVVLLES